MRKIVIALGLIVGIFFIVRAVVELLTIDYSDASSYADDWGDRVSPASCWFIAGRA